MKAFFLERKIRKNIILLLIPFILAFDPQGGKSNQHKAERARAKKEKVAKSKYEKGVSQHMNNQSKETKAMMKKARKSSKKNSPVKPTSRKKCS